MLTFEHTYWRQRHCLVAGLDEAGRGPLAGPVVAAAVILEQEWAEAEQNGLLSGLTDSKKLSASRREEFSDILHAASQVTIGVGISGAAEIDQLNILRATHLAMSRAVQALARRPTIVLVDGLPVQGLNCASESIVKGDSLSLSIAAASVIAKVFRDARMREMDRQYPVYGFACHKGYGTKAHLSALYCHGPCPEHRRSFAPVREAEENRTGGPCQRDLFRADDQRP